MAIKKKSGCEMQIRFEWNNELKSFYSLNNLLLNPVGVASWVEPAFCQCRLLQLNVVAAFSLSHTHTLSPFTQTHAGQPLLLPVVPEDSVP